MSDKIDKLRISLARHAVLFAARSRKATSSELLRLNTSLNLLTQAQLVATSSENEAKKLLALAINIANSEGKDEQRKPDTTVREKNSNK